MNLSTLTIGIPTANRLFPLIHLIHSLRTQSFQDFEIIISDDGGLYDLEGILRKIYPHLEYRLVQGPHINAPRNRQNILNQTQTKFLLLCDDDHYLDRNCVRELMRVIKSSGKIGAVSAIWPYKDALTVNYEEVKDKQEYCLDLDSLTEESDSLWKMGDQLFFHFHKPPRILETQHTGGGCVLFRKAALLKAGGFPSCYSILSFRDDTDISHRIFLSGYKIYLNPKAIAHHYRIMTGGVKNDGMTGRFRESDGKLFLKRLSMWRKNIKKYGHFDFSKCCDAQSNYETRKQKKNISRMQPLIVLIKRIKELFLQHKFDEACFLAIRGVEVYPDSAELHHYFRSAKKIVTGLLDVLGENVRIFIDLEKADLEREVIYKIKMQLMGLKKKIRNPFIAAGLDLMLSELMEIINDRQWKTFLKSYLRKVHDQSWDSETDGYRIASLMQKVSCYENALKGFECLIKKSQNENLLSGSFFHIGEIYYIQRKWVKSYVSFMKCLEINPKHQKAKEFLKKMDKGRAWKR